jgi:hypothetical protein
VKYPDGKVKLEYSLDGQCYTTGEKTISFYLLPGFSQKIAFSVVKKGKKVHPQMLGIFNPSIRLQEIEMPI